MPAASFVTTVREAAHGAVITVEATTLVLELCLFPDRLDPAATVDRMLITLLPGETTELRVTCPRLIEPEAMLWPPILRAANDGVRFG